METTRKQIVSLNKALRGRYTDANNIRHWTGPGRDETHLTFAGNRIFAGWTEDLHRELENGGLR